MKHLTKLLILAVLPLLLVASTTTTAEAGLGLGVHYLNTVGDIKDNPEFDSSAFGFLASYTMGASLIHFEADLEWIPDYAFGKDMFEPQAYAFIGSFIYGGVGIGIGHINGEWLNDPFYALRAGVKLSMLDLFTSYKFQSWDDIEGLNSNDANALTLGAIFRF